MLVAILAEKKDVYYILIDRDIFYKVKVYEMCRLCAGGQFEDGVKRPVPIRIEY